MSPTPAQQAERQRLIDRAKASISTNDIVVEQLSTHQGRLGQSDFTKRDHSINGCAIICLLVISLYFCGLSGREFIIGVAHIIDSLCQPILQLIRLGLETSSYEFVTFQVAFEAMQALGLLPGGCEQTRQYAAAALQSHGYEQHSLQNRTAVTITGDAIILRPPPSQPHLPVAQLLPAPQWGPSLGSVAVGRPEETKEVGGGGGGQDNGDGCGGASGSDFQVECGDDDDDDDDDGEESAYQDTGVVGAAAAAAAAAAAVSQSGPDGGHGSQNPTMPLTKKEKMAASKRKARMKKKQTETDSQRSARLFKERTSQKKSRETKEEKETHEQRAERLRATAKQKAELRLKKKMKNCHSLL